MPCSCSNYFLTTTLSHNFLLILLTTGVDKFLSKCPIFWANDFICAPDRASNKIGSARLTESTSI